MGRRPVSITVMAIIGIVWASLSLLMSAWGMVTELTHLGWTPQLEKIMNDSLFKTYRIANMCTSVPLALLLLAASIRSLALRPWARTAMNVYSCLYIVISITSTLFSAVYIAPKMSEVMLASAPPGGPDMKPIMLAGQIIGGVCTLVVMLAFPVCALIFYNRKVAREAFQGVFRATGTDFPVGEGPAQPPAEDAGPFP